jgi:hypothetical protein
MRQIVVKKFRFVVAGKNLVSIFAPLLNETVTPENIGPDGGIGRRASFRD